MFNYIICIVYTLYKVYSLMRNRSLRLAHL
ncbi:hypothetical protein OKW42_001152 [Paraburkholderia sp. WC7.3d]